MADYQAAVNPPEEEPCRCCAVAQPRGQLLHLRMPPIRGGRMSIIRLTDGRLYEARETAAEFFSLLAGEPHDAGVFVHLVVRQPGRKSARFKGLTVQQGLIASIEDDGLGHAVTTPEVAT